MEERRRVQRVTESTHDQPMKVDDVIARMEKRAKRKKAGGRAKGVPFEREIANMFAAHYGEKFTRTDSGSKVTANFHLMDDEARRVLAGDLSVGKFRFKIECKKGYGDEADLNCVFCLKGEKGGSTMRNLILGWIGQATKDADFARKLPMIVWRPDGRPIICGYPQSLHSQFSKHFSSDAVMLFFEGFVFIRLTEFFRVPKEEVFEADAH